MNAVARLHLALVLWHLTWLTFWLKWEPTLPEPTTADSADRWLRDRISSKGGS